MFKPRILSRTPRPFGEIAVELCPNNWTATSEYDLLVDSVWAGMRVREGLWDGRHYRVVLPDQLDHESTMRLGGIRYRYIATYRALHQDHARCALDPLHHLSTIALIRTVDGQFLFGRRAANGSLELIGGGVQQDELTVSSGADLERNLLKEINEETGIARDHIDEISGRGGLFSSTSNILLLAMVRLRIPAVEVTDVFRYRPDKEMSKLAFIPEEALRSLLRTLPDYRALIPGLL